MFDSIESEVLGSRHEHACEVAWSQHGTASMQCVSRPRLPSLLSPHTGLLVFALGTLPPVRLFARPARRSSVVLCWFSRMNPTRAAGV